MHHHHAIPSSFNLMLWSLNNPIPKKDSYHPALISPNVLEPHLEHLSPISFWLAGWFKWHSMRGAIFLLSGVVYHSPKKKETMTGIVSLIHCSRKAVLSILGLPRFAFFGPPSISKLLMLFHLAIAACRIYTRHSWGLRNMSTCVQLAQVKFTIDTQKGPTKN